MRINHNITALNTFRQLSTNAINTQKSLEKLSSGLRINRAGDDAAGLAISEKMHAQIRGLKQASSNAQDAISLIQTAEGALNETHSILQRMRELANQASNETYTDSDRNEIQNEINQLTSEINRIGNTTEFNAKSLLNGGISITGQRTETIHISTELNGEYAVGMSDLDIANDTTLEAGSYRIDVVNSPKNDVLSGQSGNIDDALVTADNGVELDEGSYVVNVTNEVAKGAGNVTDTSKVLKNDISIHSDSSLADGDYTIEIGKTTVKNATEINNGGISNIDAGDTEDGNYTITTRAKVTGTETEINKDGIAELYAADGSGAIGDITVEKDSILSSAKGLKIELNQITSKEESFNTAHYVTQGLTFRAIDGNKSGKDLSIAFVAAAGGAYQEETEVSVVDGVITVTLATDEGDNAKLEDFQGLEITAKNASVDGNYTINLVSLDGSGDPTITVSAGNTITIAIDEGTTTTKDIEDLLNTNAATSNLISVTGGSDSTLVVGRKRCVNRRGSKCQCQCNYCRG
jgi:flagellin-like hook-associated protein FlgL